MFQKDTQWAPNIVATARRAGQMSAADYSKLAAMPTVTSVASPLTLTAGVLDVQPSSGTLEGSMSSADYTKLAGIASGATANSTTVNSPLVNVGDALNPNLSIAAASGAAAGTMSATDKTRLDGLYSPPAVQYTHNATIAVTTGGSGVFANLNTAIYDTHSIASVVGSVLRFTVPSGWAGIWEFSAGATFAASAAGTLRQLATRVNGSNFRGTFSTAPNGATFDTSIETRREYPLVVGDYVELRYYHDAGVSLNVQTSTFSPWFGMRFVRP